MNIYEVFDFITQTISFAAIIVGIVIIYRNKHIFF